MNFLDYAFLQNAIDQHDAHNASAVNNTRPAYTGAQPIYSDVRNVLQSKCEMWSFENNLPAKGQKYGMYLSAPDRMIGKYGYYNPQPATLTNFMGERFDLDVTFGASWTRYGQYGDNTYTVVHARRGSMHFRGVWSRQWDLVIMRRIS